MKKPLLILLTGIILLLTVVGSGHSFSQPTSGASRVFNLFNKTKETVKQASDIIDKLKGTPPQSQSPGSQPSPSSQTPGSVSATQRKPLTTDSAVQDPFSPSGNVPNPTAELVVTPKFQVFPGIDLFGGVPIIFSPDEQLIAGLEATNVLIMQTATGKVISRVELPAIKEETTATKFRLRFSKDGKQLAVVHPEHVFIINLTEMKLTFAAHGTGGINGVSPSFKYAVVGDQVWNLFERKLQRLLPGLLFEQTLLGHQMQRIFTGSIFSNSDDILLATSNSDELLEINLLTANSRVVNKEVKSFTYPLVYTVDKKVVLNNFQMIDHQTGLQQPFPEPSDPQERVSLQNVGLTFYDEGRKFITNYGYQVCLWERGNSKPGRCVPAEKGFLFTTISPSGQRLFAIDGAYNQQFIELATKAVEPTTPPVLTINTFTPSGFCFSKTASRFYIGSTTGLIKEFDLLTGQLSDFAKLPVPVYSLSCYQDKGLFVQGSPETQIFMGSDSNADHRGTPTVNRAGFVAYSIRFSDRKVVAATELPISDEIKQMIAEGPVSYDRKQFLSYEDNELRLGFNGQKGYCKFYFVADSPADYLVIHSDGRFDGTPTGLKLLMKFQPSGSSDPQQNSNYTPGLLKKILSNYLTQTAIQRQATEGAKQRVSSGVIFLGANRGDQYQYLFSQIYDANTGDTKPMATLMNGVALGSFTNKHMLLKRMDQRGVLQAVDPLAGSVFWTFTAPSTISMVTEINGRVYTVFEKSPGNSVLVCLDGQSGTRHWQQEISYTSQPVVESDGIALICPLGEELLALDVKTGARLWHYGQLAYRNFMHPITYNGVVFLKNSAGNMLALSLKTGTKLYEISCSMEFDGQPMVHNNILYTNNRAVDAQTGKLFWEIPLRGHPIPALVGDVLCVDNDMSALVGIDARSGQKKWQISIGRLQRPMLAANGLLIIKEKDGNSFAQLVGIDPATGTRKWEYPLGKSDWTKYPSLTCTNGIIYATSEDQLHAVDVATGGKKWSTWMKVKLRNPDLYILTTDGQVIQPTR